MANYNELSKKIVKTWFEKAKNGADSYNYFDRFISLWVSFNCFFVAEFFDDAKTKSKSNEPKEKDYLKVVKEKEEQTYSGLLDGNEEFKRLLLKLKDLVDGPNYITREQGKIMDMRPGDPSQRHGEKFKTIKSFKQFLSAAYQIRCNLFHGNKDPYNGADERLVKAIFLPLLMLLEKIYQQKGYILAEIENNN